MTREQDMRVAELLGWVDIQEYAYTPAGIQMCGTPPPRIVPMWNTGRSIVPYYSTDIAAAWLVVEYMRDLWTAATEGSTDRPNLPGSFRSFVAPFDDGAFFDVLHRNADRRWPWAFLYVTPEAIVRAFLAAVDAEEV